MDLVKAGPHHFGNSSLLVHVHSSMRQGSSVELYIRSLGTSIHDRWGLTTTIVFVGFQLMPRTQNSSSIYSLPRCYGGPERDDPASALIVLMLTDAIGCASLLTFFFFVPSVNESTQISNFHDGYTLNSPIPCEAIKAIDLSLSFLMECCQVLP